MHLIEGLRGQQLGDESLYRGFTGIQRLQTIAKFRKFIKIQVTYMIHACIHACIHAYMQTYKYTYIHINVNMLPDFWTFEVNLKLRS